MPFVRYARDRRGYETLYVMHAFESADGNARNARVRVLYACRTVPYAKVGRMTIDDNVQRRLETAYPNLSFDWPKLLKEAAQSAPRPERQDPRQEQRRGRGKKKETRQQVREVRQVRSVQVPEPAVEEQGEAEVEAETSAEVDVETEIEETATPEPLDPVTELIEWGQAEEPAEPDREPIDPTEPTEPIELAAIGALLVDRSWPVVGIIGADRTLILRGRYIEIADRVLSRVSDPAEQRRLFREAGRLNPEAWQTDEQARAGVAAFEEVYSRLAEQLKRPRPL